MRNKHSKSYITEETTVIGSGVTLTGNLHDKGPIAIYGKAKGEIVSNEAVFVGESAEIYGPITSRAVTIAGKTVGNVHAEEKLDILSSGLVEGGIKTHKLSILPGAVFIGESDMEEAKSERLKGHEEVDEPVTKPQSTKIEEEEKEEEFDKKTINSIYEVEE